MRSHWFLPETPDVLATLTAQADTTVAGITAFAAWAHGDAPQEAAVRTAEHEADRVRRELLGQLRRAFSTPVDQEDLFTLSELLDGVMNAVKNLVREAEVLDLAPDPPVAAMADELLTGVRNLRTALAHLVGDGDEATGAADAAVASERHMEKVYRQAMRDLLAQPDLRLVIARREVYRRALAAGELLAAAGDRVWYAVVKES